VTFTVSSIGGISCQWTLTFHHCFLAYSSRHHITTHSSTIPLFDYHIPEPRTICLHLAFHCYHSMHLYNSLEYPQSTSLSFLALISEFYHLCPIIVSSTQFYISTSTTSTHNDLYVIGIELEYYLVDIFFSLWISSFSVYS